MSSEHSFFMGENESVVKLLDDLLISDCYFLTLNEETAKLGRLYLKYET